MSLCAPKTSSFNSDHEDLSTIARENDIPFKYTIDINSKQNISWIKSFNADIIFCLVGPNKNGTNKSSSLWYYRLSSRKNT